jgi:hypothetical protein
MLAKPNWMGLTIVLVLVSAMCLPHVVMGCPGCKEAVAAQDMESDSDVYNPSQLALAYNYSIYLMLGMPYLLTAFFGAACYVMTRRARRQNSAATDSGALPTGEPNCGAESGQLNQRV